jgi:uncharacterized protein (TIGR03437 family)
MNNLIPNYPFRMLFTALLVGCQLSSGWTGELVISEHAPDDYPCSVARSEASCRQALPERGNWILADNARLHGGWVIGDLAQNPLIRLPAELNFSSPYALKTDRRVVRQASKDTPANGFAETPTLDRITPPFSPELTVVVSSVVSAASMLAGPVAPGSLVTLFGSNLSGQNVAVTFEGIRAPLLEVSDTQIILQVPVVLVGIPSAKMVVTVDGVSSAPQTVMLTPMSPAIFNPGILNQDNSVNGASSPAPVGSVVQIFATGLTLLPDWKFTAKIGEREIEVPNYVGPAPGFRGMQQMNITIPDDLAAMTTEVFICATQLNTGQEICSSPPAEITLSNP